MKLQKRRIDHLLVERGLVDSRTKAQALIMAGKVFSEDGCVDKPGIRLKTNALLRVSAKDHPWVGRGGLKLAHALEVFRIDPKNCICLDIGASTGGFTDVLLSHGAARVFAVDVGRGQLAWKLQTSDRVIVMYLGKVCEIGDADALYSVPAHPYTRVLLASAPEPAHTVNISESAIRDEVPSPIQPPSGCRFRTRCSQATDRCSDEEPEIRKVSEDHFVACHFPIVDSSTI